MTPRTHPFRLALALIIVVGALAVSVTPALADGRINVTKQMCESIGDNNTCEGRDESLSGYEVKFQVHPGQDDSQDPVEEITVTLSQGGGSQGSANSPSLPSGTYTVCEVEIARSGSTEVPLDARPRPSESSGGTNQSAYGDRCIVVVIGSGNDQLDFLDVRADEATPTPTSTSTPTNTPTPTSTSTSTPTPTSTPTETPTPTSTPDPSSTPTNTPTPTSTPEPTNTPDPSVTPDPTNTPDPSSTPAPTNTPAPTSTVSAESTAKPTSTVASLPKTGGPQDGSLALVGLVLALGGVLAYRLSSAQRPTTANSDD